MGVSTTVCFLKSLVSLPFHAQLLHSPLQVFLGCLTAYHLPCTSSLPPNPLAWCSTAGWLFLARLTLQHLSQQVMLLLLLQQRDDCCLLVLASPPGTLSFDSLSLYHSPLSFSLPRAGSHLQCLCLAVCPLQSKQPVPSPAFLSAPYQAMSAREADLFINSL